MLERAIAFCVAGVSFWAVFEFFRAGYFHVRGSLVTREDNPFDFYWMVSLGVVIGFGALAYALLKKGGKP